MYFIHTLYSLAESFASLKKKLYDTDMKQVKTPPHEEVFSFVTRLLPLGKKTSFEKRFGPITQDDFLIASLALKYLAEKPDFIKQFNIIDPLSLKSIGKGWNGIVYQVTNTKNKKFAFKVANDEGPVAGFGYRPTKKGYQAASNHLMTLKNYAALHKLPHLVSKNQEIFFIPSRVLQSEKGKIITVQPFYEPLLGTVEVLQLKIPRVERTRIQKEFAAFVEFFRHLDQEGLLLDLLGYQNLALTVSPKDKLYHFVLCDIGPANKKIAGYFTEVGLQVSLWKEIGKWSVVFGSAELQQFIQDILPIGKIV